jgi:putative spermidine/putrescine transport system permease protein
VVRQHITTEDGTPVRERQRSPAHDSRRRQLNGYWLLSLPGFLFLAVFFVTPVTALLAIALNPSVLGVITFQPELSFDNFVRFFTTSTYLTAAIRSFGLALVVVLGTLVLGYPLGYLVAKTEHVGWNTILVIIVLGAMQLDIVVRMYGMMVLLGDQGLVNSALRSTGLFSGGLPLMYNEFGVIVGLVQLTLPFMVLSLIGTIRGINPALEEAARSLGASRWSTFWKITFPLSMPGIMAGSLIVFAISISSYLVPALMGGWRVAVLPIHIYQQIADIGNWQFGAAIATVLFAISLLAVYVYHRTTEKRVGGLV